MRGSIRSVVPLLFIILSVILSGCSSASPGKAARAQARSLDRAAQRLGVPVRAERAITINQGGASFLSAPAANLETVPATELPRGVNVAVAYLDSPQQSFPADFYTLRAIAEPQQPGTVEGRMQIIGRDRTVVSEVPATFEISTMTLPVGDLVTNLRVSSRRRVTGSSCNSEYETCSCCTNGWIVCTSRLWQPVLADLPILPVLHPR